MTVGQLRRKHLELSGEESRSNHMEFLFKRIARRMQAVAEGGLSERARRARLPASEIALPISQQQRGSYRRLKPSLSRRVVPITCTISFSGFQALRNLCWTRRVWGASRGCGNSISTNSATGLYLDWNCPRQLRLRAVDGRSLAAGRSDSAAVLRSCAVDGRSPAAGRSDSAAGLRSCAADGRSPAAGRSDSAEVLRSCAADGRSPAAGRSNSDEAGRNCLAERTTLVRAGRTWNRSCHGFRARSGYRDADRD
ncbi:MAG: DUF2924 domain-containing protein [Acidobacteria bacterium]|nr:DUF2924 domain-containing protein [Acidobacteriota bacterium]